MKKLLPILAIVFGHVCSGQSLSVTFDTTEIEIPGAVRPWIAYEDLILAFFETSNPYTSMGELNFYIIDSKEKTQRKIFVPEELQANYIDLYVKNDTVYTTEYWDQNTYYFDFHNYEWVKTRKGDDLIYEDEDYYVTSLNFGEWGGATWFIDKETKMQLVVGITTPVVNKFRGDYYLTTGRNVYQITNPTSLNVSSLPFNYENIALSSYGEWANYAPSSPLKGVKKIFQNTSSSFESDFHIATSFLQGDQLFYLCVDSNELYIGQIKNMKMQKVYAFDNAWRPLRWHDHYRNRIQNNEFQSLQFTTANDQIKGLFIFNSERLQLKLVKNSYRIPILGQAVSTQWFLDNFDFYFKNTDSLYLSTVDSLENEYLATDITPKHKMSTDLKPELDLETPRCYRKIEDSLIVLETQYYYTASNEQVHILHFEWGENRLFETGLRFVPDEQNQSYFALAKKLKMVKTNLIAKFGDPNSDREGLNWMESNWKTEKHTITLHSNKPKGKAGLVTEIELTFYKN
jgi:hypothetical protein